MGRKGLAGRRPRRAPILSTTLAGQGGNGVPHQGHLLEVCHDCGLLQRVSKPPPGGSVRCVRCGALLSRHLEDTLNRSLALALATLALYLVAMTYPFLEVRVQGQPVVTSLPSAVASLHAADYSLLAALVGFTAVLTPATVTLLILYVLIPLKIGWRPLKAGQVFGWLRRLVPWEMVDVFFLAVLVSIVKLAGMASVIPGVALWAFLLLLLTLSGALAALDPEEIWVRLGLSAPTAEGVRLERPIVCHNCGLLMETPRAAAEQRLACRRCAAPLHRRKPDSLSRTWALVIAALILYVPANLLPIMRVTSLGHEQSDTILSGVRYFLEHGDWPLALVIFVASVVVPLTKILILILLLISVQRRSRWKPKERTRLYRLTEVIGRWSMVDIYVVTVMVALIHLGNLATIDPAAGAVYFAAVVITTMFAAMSFDPRLIWDALEEPGESRQSH